MNLSHSIRHCLFIYIVFSLCNLISAQVDEIGTEDMALQINGHALKIPYFSNGNIDVADPEISHVIIVIHGTNRNAGEYFESMMTAVSMQFSESDSMFIVAPQFLTEDDIDAWNLNTEYLYWSNGGWKSGSNSRDESANPRPDRISSYAVLDSLLFRIGLQFPNLKTIVFTGHSAGGQLTNRYSATTPLVDSLCENLAVSTKFIVANPSSYLYLDKNRRIPGTTDQFAIPNTSCTTFNEWKYGLDDLYAYPSQFGITAIRNRLLDRQVVYLLGKNDNDPNASSLDMSCEAMLQGDHRLERGIIYFNYLQHFFGNNMIDLQSIAFVDDVGHNHFEMYTSNTGLFHLFNSSTNACGNVTSISHPVPTGPKVQVYPNPTGDILSIRSNDDQIFVTIFDAFGVQVFDTQSFTDFENHVDLSHLINGLYLLCFKSPDGEKRKWIIKH